MLGATHFVVREHLFKNFDARSAIISCFEMGKQKKKKYKFEKTGPTKIMLPCLLLFWMLRAYFFAPSTRSWLRAYILFTQYSMLRVSMIYMNARSINACSEQTHFDTAPYP